MISFVAPDLSEAWRCGDLQALADAIDTGDGDADLSRALVVFNSSRSVVGGFVTFPVDMPWRRERALPPVRIGRFGSNDRTQVVVAGLRFTESDADPGRGRLSFDLAFEVSLIPAQGWDTYIAEYAEGAAPAADVLPDGSTQALGCRVVETLRHNGLIPARGYFDGERIVAAPRSG